MGALPSDPKEVESAAELYRTVSRPTGRELDLAIAAASPTWKATLWTLNVEDFVDIPGRFPGLAEATSEIYLLAQPHPGSSA